MKARRRAVSLHDELLEIGQALDAVRMLAHLADVEAFDGEGDLKKAPRTIEAVVALAKSRLELVCRCISEEVDPRVLLAPHNDATDAPQPEGWTDVLLKVWDEEIRATASAADRELRRQRR